MTDGVLLKELQKVIIYFVSRLFGWIILIKIKSRWRYEPLF